MSQDRNTKNNKTKTKLEQAARPRRAKTFTGCWTCRARKVKCDLRRPGCLRCDKSGLDCGGYDIKLRWSQLVKFDPYGVQVQATSSSTEHRVSRKKNKSNEPHYQRRNIDFVKYDEEYVFHEDMDDELSILHAPPPDKVANGKTWIIKKFGVFRGIENVESTYSQRKRRRPNLTTDTTSNESTVDIDPPRMQFPGYESISNELKDDFLLSTFASQGATIGTSQIDSINNRLPQLINNSSPSPADEGQTINHLLRYLVQSNPNLNQSAPSPSPPPLVAPPPLAAAPPASPHKTHTSETPVPIIHHFSNKKGCIPLDDQIVLDSPANDSHMPRTVIQLVPSILDDTNLQSIDPIYTIPQTGLLVHGLTRFLLNHYINNVADLMTVIPVENNPWKSLYFPRALAALGDLTGLGHTSNSRNSLLNALLAVSCFHLKSKFDKDSTQQMFFLNLGIEFRCQASGFLNKCLNESVNNERYKDVLTAILSMNSIDVVWGTMTDCQRHLTICEDFIETRMKSRPRLTKKAKILHRIFSFLKLIQDSTALDKVRPQEIVFTEPNDDDPNKKSTHAPIRDSPTTTGVFRESVNSKDGKIHIEYIKHDDIAQPHSVNNNTTTTTTTPTNDHNPQLTPPMFSNIASMSYYPVEETTSMNNVGNAMNVESKIPGTDALYGLPNSLILLFSDCVRIARHTEYYNMKYISVPREFNNLTIRFEKRLLKWKSEWDFYKDTSKKEFISDTVEALYHHTMSFYYGLVIYYFTMTRALNNDFLQNYVLKVLKHLKLMTKVIKEKNIQLVPLMWQGFIGGCSATEEDTQNEFKEWAADLAGSGMGSYWGARQVMYEVWKRRKNEETGDSWFAVYKDWEMNLMLS
ncbi:arginine metabolism regulation protein II [Monosporozyma servazzii]